MELAKARPLTALFLGLIAGLAIAVLLQQAGVWPLDKMTVFLLPGIVALILIVIARIRRAASPAALTVALILLLIPIGFGLTGIGELDENGQLDGGCTVEAHSGVDSTIVTDTSRSGPFVVEPEGPLSWFATSPGPIMNHEWEIWVVVGNFEFVVADGAETNSEGTEFNEGDEASLEGYVEDLAGQSGDQIRGIYEVGGFIDGEGGACDGFGFVRIEGGFLSTIVSWIALILLIIVLIIFFLILYTGRPRPLPDSGTERVVVAAGSGAVVGSGTAGLADEDDEDDKGNTADGSE